jgi:hypothetical protein
MAVREHIGKGNLALGRLQFEQAIAEYEQALSIDPTSSIARDNIVLTHNNWGIHYFRQKKYDDARNEWNEALKLNPSDRNAKQNLLVLKNTLAKLDQASSPAAGVSSPASSTAKASASRPSTPEQTSAASLQHAADKAVNDVLAPPGSQAAKEDEGPAAGVVLLTPGHQNQSLGKASAVDAFTFSDSNVTPPSSSGATLLPSQILSGAANHAPAATGNSSANAVVSTAPNVVQPAAVVTFPAQPVSSYTPPPPINNQPSPASGAGGNLESTLAALEMKVYGSANKSTPILQRLERLEKDTNSHTNFGGIADRIQALSKIYGL